MFHQLLRRFGEGDVGEGAASELNLAIAGVEVSVLVMHLNRLTVDNDCGGLRNRDEHFAWCEQTWRGDVGHDARRLAANRH